ncbi:MAG: TolC family protein [Myxococcota bacterium]
MWRGLPSYAAGAAAALVLGAATTARGQPKAEEGDKPRPAAWVASVSPQPGGLTADEVALRAVRVAPEVEGAKASADEAREAAARARTQFIPNLDLLASYTRLSDIDRPDLGVGPGASSGDLFPVILDNYLLRASLTMPVSDYFFTILPRYESAAHMAAVATLRAEAERENIALQAKQALYQYIRAKASAAVALQSVTLIEQNVRDLEAGLRAGTIPRSDLTQARARLAEARVESLRANGQIDVTEMRLRRLLDLPIERPVVIGEAVATNPPPLPASQTVLLRTALAQRPEVRAMRKLVAARTESVNAEQGAYLPSLSLSGRVDYANPNPRVFPQQAEFRSSWQATAAVSWSPTALFGTSHRVDEARARAAQARADLAALEDGTAIEATDARVAFFVALESIGAARDGVESALTAYHDRSARLRVGEATITQVLEAESSLRQAQLLLVDAYVALRIAQARLEHLVGRSVPRRTAE